MNFGGKTKKALVLIIIVIITKTVNVGKRILNKSDLDDNHSNRLNVLSLAKLLIEVRLIVIESETRFNSCVSIN